MNEIEAKAILKQHLNRYRNLSYRELLALLDENEIIEYPSAFGVTYQIDVQVFWDDKSQGNIRVVCSIDDGGW